MARNELTDKRLKCVDCEGDFIFTKGEQEFFLKKAFAEPKRCSECRKKHRKSLRKKRRQLIKSLETAENVVVEVKSSAKAEVVDSENKGKES